MDKNAFLKEKFQVRDGKFGPRGTDTDAVRAICDDCSDTILSRPTLARVRNVFQCPIRRFNIRYDRDESGDKTVYPHKHLLASLGVATASLFFNQKVPFLTIQLTGVDVSVAFLSIVVGVFIDIDHLVDFQLNRWHRHESVETKFQKGRIYQPLHGIENVPILAISSIFFPFLVFPTISYLIHIVMDIYNNVIPHEAYSYIVKLRNIMTKARVR